MPGDTDKRSIRKFFNELERRRVYRVAAGYLAVGWVVLEASDLISERLGFSEQIFSIVLTLIALGFPVALVLAWTFDITSDGLVKTQPTPDNPRLSAIRITEIGIIFVLLVALAYLIVERRPPPQVSAVTTHSIGVLPFVNMSNDEDNEYFSDGISEELLNALANVKNLQVAARTSSFYFKDKDLNITEIGTILGVGMMLEGSVRKVGNQVRITAQLIKTADGFHIWSDTYDGELKNIFALQTEITRQVVRAITPLLLEELDVLPQPLEVNAKSYDAYLKGRQSLRNQKGIEDLQQARAAFELSLQTDPAFPLPYAGLCEVSLLEYERSAEPESFEAAEASCNRALVRQQDGARDWEVHAALGELYRNAGEHEKSLEEIRFAIQSRGESSELLRSKGMTQAAMGLSEQAETTLKQSITLGNNDWDALTVLGNFYFDQQRYSEAIAQYRAALELVPSYPGALIGLGAALYMEGDAESAEETWALAERATSATDAGTLGNIYTSLGLKAYYDGNYQKAVNFQLKAIKSRPADHRPWGRLAESYRGLGNKEKERSAYQQAVTLAQEALKVDPEDGETLGLMGIYYGFLGQPERAHTFRDKMLATDPNDTVWLYFASLISISLQEFEQAFDYLETGREAGLDGRYLEQDPDLQQLRQQDPVRFEQLVRIQD